MSLYLSWAVTLAEKFNNNPDERLSTSKGDIKNPQTFNSSSLKKQGKLPLKCSVS